jgi:hypothetical protein
MMVLAAVVVSMLASATARHLSLEDSVMNAKMVITT